MRGFKKKSACQYVYACVATHYESMICCDDVSDPVLQHQATE